MVPFPPERGRCSSAAALLLLAAVAPGARAGSQTLADGLVVPRHELRVSVDYATDQ